MRTEGVARRGGTDVGIDEVQRGTEKSAEFVDEGGPASLDLSFVRGIEPGPDFGTGWAADDRQSPALVAPQALRQGQMKLLDAVGTNDVREHFRKQLVVMHCKRTDRQALGEGFLRLTALPSEKISRGNGGEEEIEIGVTAGQWTDVEFFLVRVPRGTREGDEQKEKEEREHRRRLSRRTKSQESPGRTEF